METTVVRNLFALDVAESIKNHINDRVKTLSLGVPLLSDAADEEFPKFNRQYAHNPPLLVKIHSQLTEFASEQFEEKLKPSYAFLSIYNEQGVCPLHIDRPQCYRTIDYLVSQKVNNGWPLYISKSFERNEIKDSKILPETEQEIEEIKKSFEWNEIILNPNDAVLYSGTHQWHYRNKIDGETATLIFFHFVPEDFNGPLN